jgi:glycosyltransferase involved in cell wall biosynthesis
MMLRAFQELAKTQPQVRLVIVGDGPERPAIENYIRQHRLDDKVTLPGFREDIDALLREADVFLLTSRYEGISIALLEAMRAGLPAIGTTVGGIPETILDGKTGLLVAPDDHMALVKAMTTLAGSKARRDEMGKQGYAYFMQEFSLATMLARYQELYTKAV